MHSRPVNVFAVQMLHYPDGCPAHSPYLHLPSSAGGGVGGKTHSTTPPFLGERGRDGEKERWREGGVREKEGERRWNKTLIIIPSGTIIPPSLAFLRERASERERERGSEREG